MKEFETEKLYVSVNFSPEYSVAWLTSGESALRQDFSAASADDFADSSIGDFAGFEFWGRKPHPWERLEK